MPCRAPLSMSATCPAAPSGPMPVARLAAMPPNAATGARFMRSFELPFEADTEKVEASFDKGVLKISVPRSVAAEKKVKKIAIKGS